MKIHFQISDLEDNLPTEGIPNKKGDCYIYDDEYKSYFLVGFNESVENVELLRIPIDSTQTEFTFEGDIDPSKKERNAFSCIIVSLYIPILKKGSVLMTRQGKCIVCYLDELKENKPYVVTLDNRDDEILCEFTFKVTKIEWGETRGILEKDWKIWDEYRNKCKETLRSESLFFRKRAIDAYYHFDKCGQGMEGYDSFCGHQFKTDRATPCYLFFEAGETNEKYWIQLFEYIMLIKMTEYGVKNDDKTKYFFTLDLFDQCTVLIEMCMTLSINTYYLSDYILKLDGSLVNTDDYSNPCEGSDDCDGLSLYGYYAFTMFRKLFESGKIKHKALLFLAEYSSKVIPLLTYSCLNRPRKKERSIEFHLTLLFITKKWLLEHFNLDIIEDKTLRGKMSSGIYKISEVEEHMGNLNTKVLVGTNFEEIPTVLFGEGTGWIYPIQTNIYCPELEEKKIFPIKVLGAKKKMYQREDFQWHLRYILNETTFFIDHPYYPVNISSFYFSYSKSSKIQLNVKGVVSDDLYQENINTTFDIELVPQSYFYDFPDCIPEIKNACTDKFRMIPLFINEDGSLKDRCKKGEGLIDMIPPYTKTKINFNGTIPKDFKGLSYSIIPSDVYFQYEKELSKIMVGVKLFKPSPNIFLFIVWYK